GDAAGVAGRALDAVDGDLHDLLGPERDDPPVVVDLKLSNIHLGARDPDGGFVMVGKTFKGMSDEILRWQTERFRELQVDDNGWVVTLRPEQVVEIAVDGIQRSTRYPGGVALRFARVVRYRDDKSPSDADTIHDVRSVGAT
ncbi:MAG: hypothetical protein AAGE98_19640, partial [Actinomycetota bacterium]